VQPLGPRLERLAAREQGLDERTAAAHDVADDEDVGPQRELVGLVAFDHVDAERRELRAHRRIDVAVRTRHAVARGACDGGDAAHERAADAENVQMHCEDPWFTWTRQQRSAAG
jgi:hypothetical protein